MIVNEPAPDYLTLGTWSEPVANTLLQALERLSLEPLKDEKRMQYVGLRKGGIFLGDAEQLGRKHWLCIASGMSAALLFNEASFLPAKCSRIDLQCTTPLPQGWNHRDAYESIKRAKPALSVTIVESGDGFDTLYIGRRSSRRFIRLYIKPDAAGKAWLRFEVEYKKELAQQVWETTRKAENPTQLWGDMLLGEALTVQGLPSGFAGMLYTLQAYGAGKRPGKERVPTGGNTYRWLRQQVDPAILRGMYDHDDGHAIRDLVRSWAAEADMIDNELGDTLESV